MDMNLKSLVREGIPMSSEWFFLQQQRAKRQRLKEKQKSLNKDNNSNVQHIEQQEGGNNG